MFDKFDVDTLFFVYFQQGTYQQYLAAKQLKKRSGGITRSTTRGFNDRRRSQKADEYEQGTYVYFDFESGWCQRIKKDHVRVHY